MPLNKIKLERISLDIPSFNGMCSGLKIIHLSDLHILRYGSHEKKLIELVNRERPDLICITGDLVVNYKNEFAGCIRALSELVAKHGIFVVLGNAEHTLRPQKRLVEFEQALEALPVTLLKNQNVAQPLNGQTLYVVGVDDPFFQFDRFEEAVQGVPRGAPALMLVHSPDILFPRSDALVISLLDSPHKKDHFKDWGWVDSTYYGPENGDVYFREDRGHTLRIQSRQDGVAIDTILLNPYPDIDKILRNQGCRTIDRLVESNRELDSYPDLVTITASDIDELRLHGKWKRVVDPSALSGFRLDDFPLGKKWFFQPFIDPEHYFETEFTAKKGTKYHVWMRMKAHRGSPFHDSVFAQFSDAGDADGKARYRIGKSAYSKDRIKEMDLILTGHTHGGQVWIPFYGPITTMTSIGKKYVSGMYSEGGARLYVSRGFGYSALPVRLFCPPEITIFNLQ